MKPLIALALCGIFIVQADAQAQPKREWGPEQATGAPDTKEAGDLPTAWASLEPDAGAEWLEVSFEKSVEIDEVRIRETFNPGAVCKIVAISNDKKEIVLWEGEGNPMKAPADMVVRPVLGIKSDQIKIYFDTKRVRGWNEIDAVELVGVDGSRQWATNATASSYYGQNSGLAASDGLNALVLIQGGNMPKDSELRGQRIPAFEIARFEATFGEWKEVQAWAVANGYTFDNNGSGATDRHPVANVSWYDVVKWCNAKSEMEGLTPVYSNNGTTYRQGQVYPTLDPAAAGYRLPLAKEWEFAARGGANSQNYTYSGSNNIQEVAWFLGNSNSSSSSVGRKKPNESGLYDMSGNLEEWCWDKGSYKNYPRTLGGNFFDPEDRIVVVPPNTGTGGGPDYKFGHFGFRYARNAVSDTSAPSNLSEMVPVQGGTLPQGSELAGQTVDGFQIGKYEVTWGLWKEVRDWAVANNKGYDLANIGNTYPQGRADNFPVVYVSWYDAVKWCNALSEKEGLVPVYQVNWETYKNGQIVPVVNNASNGYRLPAEKEWEWAARGGLSSKGYTYSGSNDPDAVAWTQENTKRETKVVGTKQPNELGIHDMSGNVFEWCWDKKNANRRLRGGTWFYPAERSNITRRERDSLNPDGRYGPFGFRVARTSTN
jgi:formylglycine-generating enzyme required for sulfatase activity